MTNENITKKTVEAASAPVEITAQELENVAGGRMPEGGEWSIPSVSDRSCCIKR